MNEKMKSEQDIIAWLDAMGVEKYTLVPDPHHGFIVNVGCGVDLQKKELTSIPVQFNEIKGDFDCGLNGLTSLRGCPLRVRGDFCASNNRLVSLEHCPLDAFNFYFINNKITSFKGAPAEVIKNFYIMNNRLQSLEFCPKIMHGLYCKNNAIKDLEFCPMDVKEFICDEALAKRQTPFEEVLKMHKECQRIKNEKNLLSESIQVTKPSISMVSHKI